MPVRINVKKVNSWLMAPLGYAAVSGCLFLLARRAITLFGGNGAMARLLDPRIFSMGAHRLMLATTVLTLAIAVWRRSQLAILVTLQTVFSLAFLDVVRFIGTRPVKIDFRLMYPIELSLQVGWLAALCGLASLIVMARGRSKDERARDGVNP